MSNEGSRALAFAKQGNTSHLTPNRTRELVKSLPPSDIQRVDTTGYLKIGYTPLMIDGELNTLRYMEPSLTMDLENRQVINYTTTTTGGWDGIPNIDEAQIKKEVRSYMMETGGHGNKLQSKKDPRAN